MNCTYIAKIHLKKKDYAECVRFCTTAIKVGKEQKANVKTVARAMALRGRAHKKLGDVEKFREDTEKAMNFLKRIAEVKFDKGRWEECMEFCLEAQCIGQENVLVSPDYSDPDIEELNNKAFEKFKKKPGEDTIQSRAKKLRREIKMLNLNIFLDDIRGGMQ